MVIKKEAKIEDKNTKQNLGEPHQNVAHISIVTQGNYTAI